MVNTKTWGENAVRKTVGQSFRMTPWNRNESPETNLPIYINWHLNMKQTILVSKMAVFNKKKLRKLHNHMGKKGITSLLYTAHRN